MVEILAIIKHFILDQTQQVKFHRHVLKVDNLDPRHKQLLEHIDMLYTLFPDKTSITPDELRVYIQSLHPSRDLTSTGDLIDSVMAQDIGKEITQKLIAGMIEKHMASKIQAITSAIVSNQKTGGLTRVDDIMQEFSDLVAGADRQDALQECDLTFEEAITFRATDSGLLWPLGVLNRCIGGAEPSLGLIIARPDTGKTSFILNCLAYWASQIKATTHNLLYCGNEEGVIGLKARMGVSLLGCDTLWAEENAKKFGIEVEKRGGNRVRFHGGVKSTRDVETLVKRYNPLVTVLDQLPKMVLPGNKDEGPKGIANVFGWFRDKANELQTCMFGVAQADVKAGQWINMDNINGSKTDVPGELDWGIGIGMIDEVGMETARFVNIFKNKQKHGKKGRDEVRFNVDKCRYSDKP
jgi:hypothetical protein